jgi:hypothetical protein
MQFYRELQLQHGAIKPLQNATRRMLAMSGLRTLMACCLLQNVVKRCACFQRYRTILLEKHAALREADHAVLLERLRKEAQDEAEAEAAAVARVKAEREAEATRAREKVREARERIEQMERETRERAEQEAREKQAQAQQKLLKEARIREAARTQAIEEERRRAEEESLLEAARREEQLRVQAALEAETARHKRTFDATLKELLMLMDLRSSSADEFAIEGLAESLSASLASSACPSTSSSRPSSGEASRPCTVLSASYQQSMLLRPSTSGVTKLSPQASTTWPASKFSQDAFLESMARFSKSASARPSTTSAGRTLRTTRASTPGMTRASLTAFRGAAVAASMGCVQSPSPTLRSLSTRTPLSPIQADRASRARPTAGEDVDRGSMRRSANLLGTGHARRAGLAKPERCTTPAESGAVVGSSLSKLPAVPRFRRYAQVVLPPVRLSLRDGSLRL